MMKLGLSFVIFSFLVLAKACCLSEAGPRATTLRFVQDKIEAARREGKPFLALSTEAMQKELRPVIGHSAYPDSFAWFKIEELLAAAHPDWFVDYSLLTEMIVIDWRPDDVTADTDYLDKEKEKIDKAIRHGVCRLKA